MNFASDYVYAKKRERRAALPQPAQPAQGAAAFLHTDSSFFDDSDLDTNVVSARFDHLVERSNTYTGDFYPCTNCGAVLSHVSKIGEVNSIDRKRKWICDFCKFENKLMIDNEEVPKKDEVTYILEAPVEKIQVENENLDNKYLIYCIDISGSMSVTTEVTGKFNLPTDEIRRQSMRNATGEVMHRSQTKHISRLEAVQVAIEENIVKLEKSAPEKKVGLIAFNQFVNIIGDGKIDPIKMIDIDDKESIKKVADRTPKFDKIQKNKDVLSKKLLNLEEGGATALGPALYYSILIASRKKGSQVILCTDGLANKGIGSLENPNEDEPNQFYNEIAELASNAGVSVSIITIEGTTCKIGILGEVANKTGGTVNIVNPLKIKEEFSTILEEQIIATNVTASLILPKAMYIKDHANINNKQSSITKEIGNVTKETEITFEFALREDADIDLKTTKELPFQLKITYDAGDGKYLRVLTQVKKLTEDKRVAEINSDRTILASHAIQTSSNMLQKNKSSGIMSKFSSYIKKLNPVKEDNFSKETYDIAEADMLNLECKSNGLINAPHPYHSSVATRNISFAANVPTISHFSSNANNFEDMDDSDANTGYKLAKFTSKNVTKK